MSNGNAFHSFGAEKVKERSPSVIWNGSSGQEDPFQEMSTTKSHYYFVVVIIIIIIIIYVDFCHLAIWPLDSSQYVEDEETLTSHSVKLCPRV